MFFGMFRVSRADLTTISKRKSQGYHLGSLAFGSFIIAVIQFIRRAGPFGGLDGITKQPKDMLEGIEKHQKP